MQPHQLKSRRRLDYQRRCLGRPGLDAQTKLGVQDARLDVRVRMCLHAGRNTQQDLLLYAHTARQPRQALDLFEVVDHDARDARFERHRKLVLTLVVAVKIGPVGRKVARLGSKELATRNHIEPQSLFSHDPQEPRRAVRLACVTHQRFGAVGCSQAVSVGPRPIANRRLVVHVQRRSVLCG